MGDGGSGSAPAAGRALILHPVLAAADPRGPDSRLEEAKGLAGAIGLEVAHAEAVRVARPRPATLLGTGAVETFAELVKALDIDLLVVDAALTPVQQRNLERALDCKVIDRTALILEIFGARARTREGRLQVELAHLTYQRSRLVRSWTHLERQRGGHGFLGGPGERQLEMDRRIIGNRIARIRRELETVRKRRGLQRKARRRVPYPVAALVGYTNAGKTTLFNRLAGAESFAADLLFATLDPTMRAVPLPSGRDIILSDTVGFISDLPMDLVAAFRATLEEVLEADIIVHVRDVSHPDSEDQKADVEQVLRTLGANGAGDGKGKGNGNGAAELPNGNLIEVLNKIDLLDEDQRQALARRAGRSNRPVVLVSALSGEGCAALLQRFDGKLSEARQQVELSVDLSDGAALAWLYARGEVVARQDVGDKAHLRVNLDPADLARFRRRMAGSAPA